MLHIQSWKNQTKCIVVGRGVHPLKPMMHFPPISDFPPLFRIFQSLGKFFKLFPQKCMFHPPKFLMTFLLVIDSEFVNSPLFSQKPYISSLFRKIYFPLFFLKFPPDFLEIMCFLPTLHVFCFPLLWSWCIYASYNAHTGCPWLLDVPSCNLL